MSYEAKTIQEMEYQQYGLPMGYEGLLAKTAASYASTTTSGLFNRIFGALGWSQLNLEANPISVLPKYVWDKSGFRIITVRPTIGTDNTTSKGGTAESGGLMNAVQPTVETVSTLPKIMQIVFGASTVMEWIANNTKDDVWGSMSSLRTFMSVQHKELLSQALMTDVSYTANNTATNYAGTNDWESLDRLVASKAEGVAMETDGGTKYYNIYGLDREGQTKYDSTVTSAGGAAIGTTGNLTNSVLLSHLRNQRKAGGRDPTIALGSHEVYSELQEIFTPATRYPMGETFISLDVNGVSTFDGQGVGLHVTSIYGIPFIPAKDAPSTSGSSEVGRLFFLDTSDTDGFGTPRLGIQIAQPTTYNEATRNTGNYPFVNNGFVERGIYWTFGELIGRRFAGQGKIRDIIL